MKNREKIFESITHEAVPNVQSNPSSSSTKTIIENKRKIANTTDEWDDVFENIDFDELEVIPSGQLNEPKVPESLAAEPQFTTAKNKKISIPCNKKPTAAQHFSLKSPVRVYFNTSQFQSPIKKSKIEEKKTVEPILQPCLQPSLEQVKNTDLNSDLNKNSSVKYENCVFHGNIINNFYYSGTDLKN